MQASCVIMAAMATILIVTGLDNSNDGNTCGVSDTTELPQGNAALLQQALASSPGKATSQKHNQAPESIEDKVKEPNAAKPSKATQASTPEKAHSKAPAKPSLVVKAVKLMDRTKAPTKTSLVTKQTTVTVKTQGKTANKVAEPVTVRKPHKASAKVKHKLAMTATKIRKAASRRKRERHRDKAEENAASQDGHATKRKRKKHVPDQEEASQMSQLVFGATILLPFAFLMFGSPFGTSPALGETKLRDHPELFSSYLTEKPE